MSHLLVGSAVAAAVWTTGPSVEAKDALKRNKCSSTGSGASRLVPLSHETYGSAGPEAFALLNMIGEYAAGIRSVSKKMLLEKTMRDLSRNLCWGVTRVARSVSRSLDPAAGPNGRRGSPTSSACSDRLHLMSIGQSMARVFGPACLGVNKY